jgi:large subunit ribosomal protein L3
MPAAMLGTKVGMTRIYDENGQAIAVTVVQAGPCVVVQRKTTESDGYEAVQLGYGERKRSRTNAPLSGHFESRGMTPKKHLREFRVGAESEYASGDEVTVAVFAVGQTVSVTGVTKGKGFAGAMKRHGFHGGPASHGSKVHRAPMSAGATDAARVFPGQRMPGRMGGNTCKVKNLEVVDIDTESHVLVIKGAVPGANGSVVAIESS